MTDLSPRHLYQMVLVAPLPRSNTVGNADNGLGDKYLLGLLLCHFLCSASLPLALYCTKKVDTGSL